MMKCIEEAGKGGVFVLFRPLLRELRKVQGHGTVWAKQPKKPDHQSVRFSLISRLESGNACGFKMHRGFLSQSNRVFTRPPRHPEPWRICVEALDQPHGLIKSKLIGIFFQCIYKGS